jgi:hypothetical protein
MDELKRKRLTGLNKAIAIAMEEIEDERRGDVGEEKVDGRRRLRIEKDIVHRRVCAVLSGRGRVEHEHGKVGKDLGIGRIVRLPIVDVCRTMTLLMSVLRFQKRRGK